MYISYLISLRVYCWFIYLRFVFATSWVYSFMSVMGRAGISTLHLWIIEILKKNVLRYWLHERYCIIVTWVMNKETKMARVTLIDSWLYVCLSHINTISLVFCVKTFKMFCSKHNINRFYRHLNTKETMFLQRKRRDLTHTHTEK